MQMLVIIRMLAESITNMNVARWDVEFQAEESETQQCFPLEGMQVLLSSAHVSSDVSPAPLLPKRDTPFLITPRCKEHNGWLDKAWLTNRRCSDDGSVLTELNA